MIILQSRIICTDTLPILTGSPVRLLDSGDLNLVALQASSTSPAHIPSYKNVLPKFRGAYYGGYTLSFSDGPYE